MKYFIVATHGNFSREIIQSAALILGNQLDISWLSMCETTTGDEIRSRIRKQLKTMNDDDDLIILTDVLGGSICTLCTEFLTDSRVHVVSGVNMPMLLTVLGMKDFMDTKPLIAECMRNGLEGIQYINELATNDPDNLIA